MAFAGTAAAFAQVTPAAGYTPPDDTPSVKVGGLIFTDFTFMKTPKSTNADGNLFSPSSFNIGRTYINITGQVSHIVAFRITPDIVRETGTGSSLNGSLTFRLKYGYAQFNLDDWMPKGSWVRFGIQQNEFIDFQEAVYRYRFQGTVYVEREGVLPSADAGATFHTNFSKNYGDIHAGIYNGEGYAKAETNNQKAVMVRGTIRPFADGPAVARGLRITAFYDADNYVPGGQRRRFVGDALFEHARVNAGLDYLDAKDQTSAETVTTPTEGQGWSFFVTPFFKEKGNGWEALVRYDQFTPNTDATHNTQTRKKAIVGLAYWFPHPGGAATAALLFDFERDWFNNFSPAQPETERLFVHGLISF
jgi:hypothetical protein